MVRPASWRFGGIPGRTPDERIAVLSERLYDLESFLDSVHRDLAFGPLDSQYLMVNLGADETAGTALPNGSLDYFTFPFEAEVVLVQFYCLGGSATVNVTQGAGSTIFASAPVTLTSGTSLYYNEAVSFAETPQKVSQGLSLLKASTVSGTPHRIRARVILKGVSQIEPT